MATDIKAKRFTDGTAAAATVIAAAQTLGGAGNMTLAGTAATFGGTNLGQKITLVSGLISPAIPSPSLGSKKVVTFELSLSSTTKLSVKVGVLLPEYPEYLNPVIWIE